MKLESLDFTYSFPLVSILIKQTCSAIAEKYQINQNELCTLIIIHNEKSRSIKHISEKLELTGPHTSKILNALEKKGLIIRQLNDENKRNESVSITESGRNFLMEVSEFVKEELIKRILFAIDKTNSDLIHFSKTIAKEISLSSIQSIN